MIPLYIFDITIDKLSANPLADTIFTGIFASIVFLSTFFLGKFLRKLFPDYNGAFPKSIRVLFLVELLSCAGVYIYNIIEGERFGYPADTIYFNGLLFSVFFISTITIYLVCLRILKRNHELLQRKQAEEALMEYMNKLEKLFQDIRVFKHNYNNIISTLSNYIYENDWDNLRSYFDTQILPECQNPGGIDAFITQLGNLKISEVKGLLYSKIINAVNRELPIRLEIRDEIDSVPIKTLDLCKILGVFIDNAIEETCISTRKMLNIAFIRDGEHLSIVVSNCTDKTSINIQKIYEKDVTSKADHSGLGLYIVKEILDGYGNVTHSTTLRNGVFTQIIDISEPVEYDT